MKRLVLISLILLLFTTTKSQTYYPLVAENNSWNVLVAGFGPIPFWDTVYQTVTYKMTGDSVINSFTYKKLYESWQEVPVNWGLNCFIREDENKRVWMRNNAQEDEFLIYDFSLQEGESAAIGEFNDYFVVDSISIVEINGSTRQKFWMRHNEMPDLTETWTVGIGSDKGVIWSGTLIVGGFYHLLCFSQNDSLVYMDSEYLSCYIYTVGIDDQDAGRFVVFPNPAKGYLKVNNINNLDIISISLIGLAGELLCDFNPESGIIDLSSFKPGIYFLKIVHPGGFITRKIIVE